MTRIWVQMLSKYQQICDVPERLITTQQRYGTLV